MKLRLVWEEEAPMDEVLVDLMNKLTRSAVPDVQTTFTMSINGKSYRFKFHYTHTPAGWTGNIMYREQQKAIPVYPSDGDVLHDIRDKMVEWLDDHLKV